MNAPEFDLFNLAFEDLGDDEVFATMRDTTFTHLPMFRAWFLHVWVINRANCGLYDFPFKAWQEAMLGLHLHDGRTMFEAYLWGVAWDAMQAELTFAHTCPDCGRDVRHGGQHSVRVAVDDYTCRPPEYDYDDYIADTRYMRMGY